MIRKVAVNILVVLFSTIAAFSIAEIGIRQIGNFDIAGQFYFQYRPIPPFIFSTEHTDKLLKRYEERKDNAVIIYDEYLGWTLNPGYKNTNEAIYINHAGIRSLKQYELEPANDVLRIALFGDSYTYDEEVNNNNTWATRLEQELGNLGINAEVLNFGVPGYGMDQAYLRWEKSGKDFNPDIVIFGFIAKDAERNINIFRQILYPGTNIPFSKPRFILQNGELELVNSPTVPIDEIIPTLRHFHNSVLNQYEAYYDSRYSQRWWVQSNFLSVLIDSAGLNPTTGNPDGLYIPTDGNEYVSVARAITRQFYDSVTASNHQFIVAYLPDRKTLEYLDANVSNPYLETLSLLPDFEEQYVYMDVQLAFDDEIGLVFTSEQGHYNIDQSKKVGIYLAQEIVTCIDSGVCELSRFDNYTFDLR